MIVTVIPHDLWYSSVNALPTELERQTCADTRIYQMARGIGRSGMNVSSHWTLERIVEQRYAVCPGIA